MSVVTGSPVSALIASKIFMPPSRPGPRKLDPDVRFALSNDALKIKGTWKGAVNLNEFPGDSASHVARFHDAGPGDQGEGGPCRSVQVRS